MGKANNETANQIIFREKRKRMLFYPLNKFQKHQSLGLKLNMTHKSGKEEKMSFRNDKDALYCHVQIPEHHLFLSTCQIVWKAVTKP